MDHEDHSGCIYSLLSFRMKQMVMSGFKCPMRFHGIVRYSSIKSCSDKSGGRKQEAKDNRCVAELYMSLSIPFEIFFSCFLREKQQQLSDGSDDSILHGF